MRSLSTSKAADPCGDHEACGSSAVIRDLYMKDYKGNSSKLEMCMELVQNAVNGGHKLLLFSQFTTMLDVLAVRLKKAKVSFYMLTGATSKEKRAQMVTGI